MKKQENENKQKQLKDFRYGIIAELLNPYLDKKSFNLLLKEKASREYEIPYSSKTTITEAVIRQWIRKYRANGENGLLTRKRSDKGYSKSLNEKEQNVLLSYMEDHPQISATQAVKVLQQKGLISSNITQSSLSRFIIANGITRQQRVFEKQKERHLKYQFEKPLECLQADAMHAFEVGDGKGKKRKAILLAFIDDATRRILYSSFTFTEKSYEFEKGIKHILKTHGHIGKLYTDNGSTFVSEETKRILSILGIPLVHSRPRKPAGRGKIERFFRTVRDQFLRPLDKEEISNIDELNIKFKTWLEGEYHRNPHRSLNGSTPVECFMNKAKYIIRVKEEIDLDDVFLHEISRKVYKDNTFSLSGLLYETPGTLCGKKIKLRYDPAVMNPIHIYFEGSYICDARIVDTYANCKIIRDTHSKAIAESSRQLGDNETENIKNDLRIISSLSASKISGGIR